MMSWMFCWLPVASTDPTTLTQPLSADYPSAADWFLPVIRVVWRIAFALRLDLWQEDLIRRVLEVYPAGHERAGQLRYRQVVVSLARQNGKTEIAAVLGLFGLLRGAGQLVIGIASSVEQARLVYDRTLLAILRTTLRKRFRALTDTRGIRANDGGKYEIKAAKSAALQGLPLDLGVVDELHLLKTALWTDLVNGTGGRPDCFVVGITTAGDDDSALLKHLYEIGHKAAAGDPEHERFGFFLWEAPESRVPTDDSELLEYLAAANPALACGRSDAQAILSDVRGMPDADVIRYRLNRFTSAKTVFISNDEWARCVRSSADKFPEQGHPVFAIDRTPDWGYATITATTKDTDGVTWTEVVRSFVKPTLEGLANACVQLSRWSPTIYAMDGYALKELGAELKKRGLPVMVASQGEVIGASVMFFSKVKQRKIRHAGDPILSLQIPRTVRKNVGESFRISRKDSSVEIDGVMSTVLGVFAAETQLAPSIQVF